MSTAADILTRIEEAEKSKDTVEYKDCVCFRQTEPGSKLRWTARTPKGSVAADTLGGLKQLIDQKLDGKEKANEESDFKKLSGKIQKKEGLSKKSADAITAAAGRKKLGQKEMTKRSVAARKK